MTLNVAVQMDPIERIKIGGDSTLPCCWRRRRAATRSPITRRTGWPCGTAGSSRRCEPLTVRDQDGDHFTLGEPQRGPSSTEFDVVLLRQDPPFDMAYITTTHLLERIHPKTLVVNDPAEVRNAPEKLFVTDFPT